jgi:hypothetical protein
LARPSRLIIRHEFAPAEDRTAGAIEVPIRGRAKARPPNVALRGADPSAERHVCARAALRTDRRFWRVERRSGVRRYVRSLLARRVTGGVDHSAIPLVCRGSERL